jgi:hypothetical protein
VSQGLTARAAQAQGAAAAPHEADAADAGPPAKRQRAGAGAAAPAADAPGALPKGAAPAAHWGPGGARERSLRRFVRARWRGARTCCCALGYATQRSLLQGDA